ncbi:MAG: AAA family ATPase [Patescibacteria group bacterium]
MKYLKFTIKKFKGIQDLEIDLSRYPNGSIFPLVGLNESGKTTILEAINFFQNFTEFKNEELFNFMPKAKATNFSEKIEISAYISLETEESQSISKKIKEKFAYIESDIKNILITRKWVFKNAKFENKDNDVWLFNEKDIFVKKRSDGNFKNLHNEDNALWLEVIAEIKKDLPKILYFQNFLFDFPEWIYLENIDSLLNKNEEDKKVLTEYKNIIDDILKYTNSKNSVNDFLVKLKSQSPEDISASNSIIAQIETILNSKIIDKWKSIFPNKPVTQIKVIKNQFVNDGVSISIETSVGGVSFKVNQGSLGFRWFFAFILFTEFRKKREGENGEYLFLFDEPASNLHESAQKELLKIFSDISNGAKITYSTHSPYLIDDKNILNSFIVKDEGKKDDNDLFYVQDIKAYQYRNFVSSDSLENANHIMHFKPLLDALDFKEHIFTPQNNIVLLEGKFDYYTLRWMKENLSNADDFNFYPGSSINKYDQLLRDYLANNKKFIAIFDADGDLTKENGKGKYWQKKYIEDVSEELKNRVFVLSQIDLSFDNFTTESLFADEDKLKLQKLFDAGALNYNKGQFNSAVQQCYLGKTAIDLSQQTINNFKKVFDFIKDKFTQLEN